MNSAQMLKFGGRIEYIDCMRGFTMLLVVYSHIVTFVLESDYSLVNSVFLRFRMPLFFFISGFLAYTSNPDKMWLLKRLKNRALVQLLPTFIMGGLFTLFINKGLVSLLMTTPKNGYWFTFALFEIFCLYAILAYLLNKANLGKRVLSIASVLIILSTHAIETYLYSTDAAIINSDWYIILCGRYILLYTKFFFIGVLAKIWLQQFLKLIEIKFITAISAIAFAILHIGFEGHHSRFILGVLGIILVYNFFYYYHDYFSSKTKVGRILSFVGKNTLQIYFLHYFFIVGMVNLRNTNFTQVLSSNWFVELLVVIAISTVIITCCLLVDKFVRSIPWIHVLMFGPETKKHDKKANIIHS